MLHKRTLPDPVAADLRRVFDAKVRFISWLLRTPPVAGFGNAELKAEFGDDLGNWFHKRIQRGAKRTTFGKAVDELRKLAASNKSQAIKCARAIKHDVQFDKKWNSAGFEMRFSTLSAKWKDAIKAVGEPFYDSWLTNGGFPKKPFGLTNSKLTRKNIMSAFRPQSNEVCGYCDGPLGDEGTDKEANDCDHFFPKSLWPHLAIHHRNLFAACKGCNETWKLDNAPMGAGSVAELNETYHPDYRPGANAISVTASLKAAGGRELSIRITDATVPRRAETLNAVLDLEARWTKYVNRRLDRQVSEFVAESVDQVKRNKPIDQAEMEEIIATCIAYRNSRKGRKSCMMREVAVLEYQHANQIAELLVACV